MEDMRKQIEEGKRREAQAEEQKKEKEMKERELLELKKQVQT